MGLMFPRPCPVKHRLYEYLFFLGFPNHPSDCWTSGYNALYFCFPIPESHLPCLADSSTDVVI